MLAGKRIGFALTGSHCTMAEVLPPLKRLMEAGAELLPILSPAATTDTRFGKASDLLATLRELTGREPVTTIVEAEPIGPKKLLDLLVIAPCTGNTLAKLAVGITDSPVLMAAKAHLRNGRPLVLAVSTNDALGINARNIGLLLNMKNIYFVPFRQDSPQGKPNSLVARMELIPETLEAALAGRQLEPVLAVGTKKE